MAFLAVPRAAAFTAFRPDRPVRTRQSSRMLWMRRDVAPAPCSLLGCDSAFHADLGRTTLGLWESRPALLLAERCWSGRLAASAPPRMCYLVDPASSHMLVSKIKPCMCKYEQIQTVKLRMAH